MNRRDDELKLALKQRDEDTNRVLVVMNEALKKRDEDTKLMLVGMLEAVQLRRDAELRERDEALQTLLAAHGERQAAVVKQLETSLLAALAVRFGNQLLSIAGHVQAAVVAAVKDGLNLKKAQAKRRSASAQDLPEDQRGTTLQAGPLALGLSSVAVEIFPALCYQAWLRVRGAFGQHAMAERLRRHALGPQHPEYVAQPKLWSSRWRRSMPFAGCGESFLRKKFQSAVGVRVRSCSWP